MSEFLMRKVELDDLSPEEQTNAIDLLKKVNTLLERFGEYRSVNSGYRTKSDQMKINPKAPKSKHCTCQAVDLEDRRGTLDEFCSKNVVILKELGLYLEWPGATPNWCHLQSVSPASGNQIFRP